MTKVTKVEWKRLCELLIKVYGEKYYPAERIISLWETIKHYTMYEVTTAISFAINYRRLPPMKKEIDQELARAREMTIQQEKKIEKKEIQNFYSSADDKRYLNSDNKFYQISKMNRSAFNLYKKMVERKDFRKLYEVNKEILENKNFNYNPFDD